MVRPGGEELHARMRELARRLGTLQASYEAARDSRCVFTYCYKIMTTRLDSALDTSPFDEPARVVDLAERFAERYFAAMDAFDHGNLRAGAWQTVLEAVQAPKSSVIEDLIFPITAHIVHDLPIALQELSALSPVSRPQLHDFDLVNDIMGQAIDSVRDAVTRRYSPALRWVDRIERRYDQIATDYGIRMSRALAWYNAERLQDPQCRQDALQAIELSPSLLVHEVREPPTASLRFLLRAMRALAAQYRRWPRHTSDTWFTPGIDRPP
jgi:Family of unknown function (DUF5995)